MGPAVLAGYLGQQRWFAGKGREWVISDVRDLARLREGAPPVRISLVTVSYDDGTVETYQLPLVYRDEPVGYLAHALVGEQTNAQGRAEWVYDALHDKDVTGRWTHGIADEVNEGAVTFHRDPSIGDFPADEPSLVIGAEQSNTSLVFGDALILKVLRKVAAGLNPDIELNAALARAASPHIAPLIGWVEGHWEDPATGEPTSGSLAILQMFLKNATEGWEMAKTSVRDLLAEGDLHADEVGGDFASEAHRLGVVTAEVHRDLATVLPTGTLGRDARRVLADSMHQRLDEAVREVVPLAPYAAGLRRAFDELAALDSDIAVQRVHGDLHLGQVMRTLDGWKVLDFEGEPAKPLAQRRMLEPPLKDVAGMLRSLDYAAHQSLAVGASDNQREYRALEWAARNRSAFCDGYAEGSGADPRDETTGAAVVLRAFESDKAVYEVMYEVRNRPAWLAIPLGGIARLNDRSSSNPRVP